MKVLLARLEERCTVRATTSLPVPVSPSSTTVTAVGAIFSITPKRRRIRSDLPTIEPRDSRWLGTISTRWLKTEKRSCVLPIRMEQPLLRKATRTRTLLM